ncbi:7618_t:CDS:2 [Diversispora eburnea]|uniref:7618_t:CDS:1 n=1 Tax=Diversispora eburnea TaxID=1213867 RepID=A0A9N9F2X3_9GLOM|nr:7618_t:CDS:2 [Diversispora eburnea]
MFSVPKLLKLSHTVKVAFNTFNLPHIPLQRNNSWKLKQTLKSLKSLNFGFGQRNIHIFNPLPYDNVEPLFTERTLNDLIDNQNCLIETLNELITDTEFENDEMYTIIAKTAQVPEKAQLFNCASQAWNNDFFLRCLNPNKTELVGTINENIKKEFGKIDEFKKHFKYMALGLFGSGWTWLVLTEFNILRVINTYNAGTPLDITRLQAHDPNNYPDNLPNSPFHFTPTSPFAPTLNESPKPLSPPKIKLAMESPNKLRLTPLLALNVWEHAYIKDYGLQGKVDYIDKFWDVVDWNVMEEKFIAHQNTKPQQHQFTGVTSLKSLDKPVKGE